MKQSDQFRLSDGGELVSVTGGESILRGLAMVLVGMMLAGAVIYAPAIWQYVSSVAQGW